MEASRPWRAGDLDSGLFHPRAHAWMSTKGLLKAGVLVRTASRIASEAEDSGTRGAASLPDLDLGFPAGHQWTAIGAFSKISASRARVAIVVPCGSIERGKNRASRISQSGFRCPRIRNLQTRYTTT
jgi:hypothetical protein